MNILWKTVIMVLLVVFVGSAFPTFAHAGWYNRDNSYRVYHRNFYNRYNYRYYGGGYYGGYRYGRHYGRNLAIGIVLGAVMGTLLQHRYTYTPPRVYIQRQQSAQQQNCQRHRIWDRYLQQEITKTTCYSR